MVMHADEYLVIIIIVIVIVIVINISSSFPTVNLLSPVTDIKAILSTFRESSKTVLPFWFSF
jgi:hypothetical protein